MSAAASEAQAAPWPAPNAAQPERVATPDGTRAHALRVATLATQALIAGTAISAGATLLFPGLYHERLLGPAMRGQDLVSVTCLPLLWLALPSLARGGTRGSFLWLGLVGYLAYTYTGAAFAYRFNGLFPLYVVCFSLSLLSLVSGLMAIDVETLHARVGAPAPRTAVAVFLRCVAALLLISELGQIGRALATAGVPVLIARSNGAGNFVYALDLGVIAPLSLLAARWLRRGSAWGDALGACMLIKAATMGVALLSMAWFADLAGLPAEVGLTAAYAAMAAAALWLCAAFFRACDRVPAAA